MPVPYFLLFLVSEKLLRKYPPNWKRVNPELFLENMRSGTEDETKTGPEGPTSPRGAAKMSAAPGGGVAPSGAHRPRSFAYKFPPDLKTPDG